ncbi:MAG: hypothetical protein JW894_12550 [Bacteroidales bacterium]|nr:hypothetical protein [Bacteroidales bacterium]
MYKNNAVFKMLIHIFMLTVFMDLSEDSFSQVDDSTKNQLDFGAAAAITNKGISTFPNFTLGKPAAIFDLSVGNKLTFDPQFRFSLEGQPWSFIFWWHYQLFDSKKYSLKLGAHPAFLFKTVSLTSENDTNDVMVLQRYLAGQLIPEYLITQNIKLGMHYIYSHGFEYDAIRNSHYITVNISIILNQLPLKLQLVIKPEFYYLKMDESDGVYLTSYIFLAKKDFPVSVSAIMNKKIQSTIPGEDFLWNVSLTYRFNKKYISRQ